MNIRTAAALILAVLFCAASAVGQQRNQDKNAWSFAVSGDSRNCGNLVMPAIAAGARSDGAAFYWHLGDLRAIYGPDEDYQNEPEHRGHLIDKKTYLREAWSDFIQNQIMPFGPMPFYVGIGNHETARPQTRAEFVKAFKRWLDAPALRKQRLADDPRDQQPHTFYHWVQGGIDFIYLDNATEDQFDSRQLSWLENVLKRDRGSRQVRSLVVGMHVALPGSLASGHSMNDWQQGLSSGRRVYHDLLDFHQKTGKPVYLLASHSHFYMSDIYDTDYWRANGGVLPGWIVGTAGAVRYALPADAGRAKEARQGIYGYLTGTVHADGTVAFVFHQITQNDLLKAAGKSYTPDFVDYCYNRNTEYRSGIAGAK